MTSMLTTGDVARTTGLSEKAVRLYTDRGLLEATRDPRSDARRFGPDQLDRARRIASLRALGMSLADVGRVLGAPDPVEAFDEWWSARRADELDREVDAESTRAVLTGAAVPSGLTLAERDVPERLLLTLAARATLAELPAVLREQSGRLLAAVEQVGVPLVGPLHVELRSRATETFPAELVLAAPVAGPVRPPVGLSLVVDPAHREVVASVTQAQADDQAWLVAVHDHLSTGAFATDGGPVPCGHNREVYLPSFGTGAAGTVMEVVVPVRDAEG